MLLRQAQHLLTVKTNGRGFYEFSPDARAFLRGDPRELSERIEAELDAFGAALKTPQAQAALAAFLNKNK